MTSAPLKASAAFPAAVASRSGRALGCSVQVLVTQSGALEEAWSAVGRVLDDVDLAYSRFRQDSELSLLNASPGVEQRVSPLLAMALAAALRGAELTDGAVDPTIGRAIRVAGYDADFDSIGADGGPVTLRAEAVPGWRSLRFDNRTRRVLIPGGVEIDLGATGKALAADLAADAALGAARGGGVLVNLGGDVAMAGEPPAGGWTVQVSEDSGAPISDTEERVSVDSGGIATSSTTVRRWVRGGVELHHIIDPATGLPAVGPWRTVTVVARTCVDANIASTCAIVRGRTAPAWLEARRLPARLVDSSGAIARTAGWPEPRGIR